MKMNLSILLFLLSFLINGLSFYPVNPTEGGSPPQKKICVENPNKGSVVPECSGVSSGTEAPMEVDELCNCEKET